MEEDQDLKFVCKLCDKRYPCGKSLGGHMRSHVLANSATEFEEKVEKLHSWNNSKDQSKFELGGQSGYGLRENPKKTWRAVDSTCPLPQEKVCQQCGKVFQSLKALCGHMACHSDKGVLKDDHSWTSESKKLLVMDSQSDDTEAEEEEEEEELRLIRTRSKTKRYKKIVVKSSTSFCLVNNNNNGSSSVSEIDEQEQEEVAKCLMMLSRDSYGVTSVVESSDNNSVVLETKSSSTDMRFGRKNSLKCVYNHQDETPPRTEKKEEDRNLKLSGLDGEAGSENSDSAYFLDENTIVESDISVDRFLSYGNSKWSTSSKDKGINRTEERSYDDYRIDKYEARKRTKDSSYHPELGNESSKKIKLGFKSPEGSKSIHKKKYECLNCKKIFSSYQALGGHRPCHKKTNAYFDSISIDADRESNKHGETFNIRKPASTAKDASYNSEKKVKPKKFKGHECPFCDRVFKSGQALGGHKRSHFIVSNDHHNMNQTSAAKKEVDDLLDLNLPAPVDDDEYNEHAHFVSW